MMASYRFALFCNRSCSLCPTPSSSFFFWLQEMEEGKLLSVLVAGPKNVSVPSPGGDASGLHRQTSLENCSLHHEPFSF